MSKPNKDVICPYCKKKLQKEPFVKYNKGDTQNLVQCKYCKSIFTVIIVTNHMFECNKLKQTKVKKYADKRDIRKK